MKRSGENLARTVDGAPYNKLQRPDSFPVAPPRPVGTRSIPEAPQVPKSPVEDEADSSAIITPEDASNGSESEQQEAPPNRVRWKPKATKMDVGAGMRGAFPDLDDYNTCGSSDEDEEHREAMRYLRQVRAEASDLPVVVKAPSPTPEDDSDSAMYNNGIGDSRGYYSEGTYIAAPPIGPVLPDDNYYDSDDDDFTPVLSMSPQEAYTTRLLSVFQQQRDILRSMPPAQDRPPHRMDFVGCVDRHDPVPAELVAMSTKSVFRLLELVTKRLKRGQNVSPRMSAWIMSILARLDEKLMDSDSVYLVRELSRKAMWIRFGFDERFAEQTDTFEYDSESEQEGDDEDEQSRGRQQTKDNRTRRRNTSSLSQYRAPEPVPEPKIDNSSLKTATEARLGSDAAMEAARLRLLERLGHDVRDDPVIEGEKDREIGLPDSNTNATLDMIITIVGEVYGQRDLLEGRIDWLALD